MNNDPKKKKPDLEERLKSMWKNPPTREEYVSAMESKKDVPTSALPDRAKKGVPDDAINVDGLAIDPPAKPSVRDLIPKDEPTDIPQGSIRSPQNPPAVQPQNAPVAPAPQTSNTLNIPKVPKDESFPWDRLLMGATPLLVGMLTGNQLEGAQVSAKQFVDTEADLYKRERDLNGKLAEMAAKRDVAGEGGKRRFTPQVIAVEDPNSESGVTNVKATFDTFTGKYTMPGGGEIPEKMIRAGYAVNPEEDDRRVGNRAVKKKQYADYVGTGAYTSPTTGERVILRNGVEVPVDGQHTGRLTVKQEKDAEKLRNDFRQSPIVKRVLPVASSAQQLQDLLNSGKPVSQAAAKTFLARMSGEVGNLNQMEQEMYTRSPSIKAKIKGWLNLQATDEALLPHEVEDLRLIANFYTNASKELLASASKEMREVGLRDYGLPEDTVNRITSPIEAPLMGQITKAEKKSEGVKVNYKGKILESDSKTHRVLVDIPGEPGSPFWIREGEWDGIKKDYPRALRVNK